MLNKYIMMLSNLLLCHTKKLACSIIILTGILGYQAFFLRLHIDFDTLLSKDNPKIKIYNNMLEGFNNDSNIILFVEGPEDSLTAFAYDIKSVLESFDQLVFNVNIGLPIEFLRKNFLKIIDQDELGYFDKIFSEPNLVPFLSNLNSSFDDLYEHYKIGELSLKQEREIIDRLDRIKQFILYQKSIMDENEASDIGIKAFESMLFGQELNFSSNRDKLFIIVAPNFNVNLPLGELIKNVNNIERIVKHTAKQHGVIASLAGPLFSLRSYYDIFLYNIKIYYKWIMISIALLLVLFYGRYFFISILFFTLFVGVVWILGLYSLFMSGIGIVHFIAIIISILIILINCMIINYGFLYQRDKDINIDQLINNVLTRFSPSIIAGIIIIGSSFLVCLLYNIKIWKTGIFILTIPMAICLLVSLLLPLIMVVLKYKFRGSFIIRKSYWSFLKPYSIPFLKALLNYRLIIFICMLFPSIYLFYQGVKINLNFNSFPSVAHDLKNIEKEVINTFGFSPNAIYYISSNLDTITFIAKKYRKTMPHIKFASISDYLPNIENNKSRFHYIRKLRREIQYREIRNKFSSYDIKMYHEEIKQLEANIIELQDFASFKGSIDLFNKTIQLVGHELDSNMHGILTPFINFMDTSMVRIKLNYFQNQFSSAFKKNIIEMANNEPLIIGSLPSDIQRRFHDENHQLFRINIYLDKDVSNHVSLLDELSSDDINITGLFVIFKELQNKLIKNGPYIFTYLIIIILGSFFIYSHSMKNILIIIISLIIAFAWFLGSLSLLDIPLNLINIYIIPVILLVGIYFGMQIILQLNKGINIDLVGYIIRIFIALSLMGIILFFIFPIEYKVNSINIFHILFLGLMSNYFIHSIIPILLVRSSK